MDRLSPRAMLALAMLVGLLGAGCGGSGDDAGDERAGDRAESSDCEALAGEAQREECEKAKVAKRIPEADRIGYFQIATTAGLLRARAAVAAQGGTEAATAGSAALRLATRRVAASSPRDAGLRDLRRVVLALLASERVGFDRDKAQLVLARLRAVDRALNRYLRHREPSQASLLPD